MVIIIKFEKANVNTNQQVNNSDLSSFYEKEFDAE